jgi:glycosyltransferase involved in cell wall biosynthesis
MPEPSVWVSILNWNLYDLTIQCLESLRRLEYKNAHILVVDNASCNDSVNRIRSACPDVMLIESDTNRGFADGHRLALDYVLKQKDAELFWMLNNDAIVIQIRCPIWLQATASSGDGISAAYVLLAIGTGRRPHQLDANKQSDSRNRWISDLSRIRCCFRQIAHLVSDVPAAVHLRSSGAGHGSAHFFYSRRSTLPRPRKRGFSHSFRANSAASSPHVTNTTEQLRWCVYYQTRNPLFLTRRHSGHVAFWKTIRSKHSKVCKNVLRALAIRHVYRLLRRSEEVYLKPSFYYVFLGVRDAVLNRMGKTLAPEDFWE